MNLPIDYATNVVPLDYHCTACGVHGCKLWRQYQTFANNIALECCDCAAKRGDGYGIAPPCHQAVVRLRRPCSRDQIGWMVPAVPTEEGDTYWGYTSVPEDGCVWWRRLPTRVQR